MPRIALAVTLLLALPAPGVASAREPRDDRAPQVRVDSARGEQLLRVSAYRAGALDVRVDARARVEGERVGLDATVRSRGRAVPRVLAGCTGSPLAGPVSCLVKATTPKTPEEEDPDFLDLPRRPFVSILGSVHRDRIVVTGDAELPRGVKIEGHRGADRISTGAGRDLVFGGWGRDTIHTGAGDDLVRPGWDRDVVRGGAGNDRIDLGDDDPDVADAGPGDDRLEDLDDTDRITCGSGDDTVNFETETLVPLDCERLAPVTPGDQVLRQGTAAPDGALVALDATSCYAEDGCPVRLRVIGPGGVVLADGSGDAPGEETTDEPAGPVAVAQLTAAGRRALDSGRRVTATVQVRQRFYGFTYRTRLG